MSDDWSFVVAVAFLILMLTGGVALSEKAVDVLMNFLDRCFGADPTREPEPDETDWP